ncbi:MAG: hypothetical protein ACLTYN_18635 [Dysosmobacter welbionis]
MEIKRDFVDRDVPGILDLTLSVYPAEQDGAGRLRRTPATATLTSRSITLTSRSMTSRRIWRR